MIIYLSYMHVRSLNMYLATRLQRTNVKNVYNMFNLDISSNAECKGLSKYRVSTACMGVIGVYYLREVSSSFRRWHTTGKENELVTHNPVHEVDICLIARHSTLYHNNKTVVTLNACVQWNK